MNKHQRALKAAQAAKRIPIVGTATVLLPVVSAASQAGLSSSTIANMQTWKQFGNDLVANFTGVDPSTGQFAATRLVTTYSPIAVYLLARRFAGKHITSVLKPLHVRF